MNVFVLKRDTIPARPVAKLSKIDPVLQCTRWPIPDASCTDAPCVVSVLPRWHCWTVIWLQFTMVQSATDVSTVERASTGVGTWWHMRNAATPVLMSDVSSKLNAKCKMNRTPVTRWWIQRIWAPALSNSAVIRVTKVLRQPLSYVVTSPASIAADSSTAAIAARADFQHRSNSDSTRTSSITMCQPPPSWRWSSRNVKWTPLANNQVRCCVLWLSYELFDSW